eukprot:CAMPEP_0119034416 /NCGR_PEP_ID=MMETSP1177-20130426/1401_1 /TAXON_ID=2985 /ORGANISM="Ochromonas sp, Strain CCMP1899" /LENGTH=366 /DNA_ID=CAMNT_0006991829 /DNA_START=133 /DNA_END=1233 /DNA_ORIENTATION=+
MSFSKCLILILLAFQVLYSESVAVESVALPRSLPDTIRKHSVLGRKNNLKRNSVIVAENNGNDLTKFGNNGESEVSLNAFDLCLCGAFATAFGDFVMHPVDTIKVSQQASVLATNMFQTIKSIWSTNGVAGFYPGVFPYMAADGLSGAVKFATFEISKVFLERKLPVKFHPSLQFLCAAGAMVACSFIMVPGEVIKIRLQAGLCKTMTEGITQTLKQDGILGLFVGYSATLIRDVPYTMMELGLYENIKSAIRKVRNKSELSQQEELCAAAVTGGITSFLTTPLDLIKTKLMIQSGSGGQYKGFNDALSSIYKAGGIQALFVGSAARVSWLLPFTTIYLGVYEVSKRKLLTYKKTQKVSKKLSAQI